MARFCCIFVCLVIAVVLITGCSPTESDALPGYIEGEFVRVASKLSGQLNVLSVTKGARIDSGVPLFTLEREFERQAVNQAKASVQEAVHTLHDMEKGSRPEELDQIRAEIKEIEARLKLLKLEYSRRTRLYRDKSIAQETLDITTSEYQQTQANLQRLRATLDTAKLASRIDRIKAAQSDVDVKKAALAQAQWNFDEKHQAAPQAGLVFDTLYREGEWVGAGQPVISLLPPENVKARFFIPENQVATLESGQTVFVHCDGCGEEYKGTISYISAEAEYSPPVIFSQVFRTKLVFMVEAVFPPEVAAKLHPGQPIDVYLHEHNPNAS
ncbi:HlyD family secretion protein [Desulfovibrio inopinatus]|uniref:HlyD family secretion protein n=1 Tax=Desulfovibrio inopinatus TaxID=102109 RepID=UPI00040BED99|nr:HlyD family efflux transporter periplasmic adaptor subunit [Desulfovibrio inopinatus]